LVGFVNGPSLVVIKLKKPGVPARAAFDENSTHYQARIDTSRLIPLPIRCGEGNALLVQRAAHRLHALAAEGEGEGEAEAGPGN
jgi:hypothetical protein